MTSVERSIVVRKLARILENVDLLRKAAPLALSSWLADRDVHDASLHRLQICIEAAIDVNAHLLVEAGHPSPSSGHQSFLELSRALRAIPAELAVALAPAAAVRNRIVHRYDDVDEALLLAAVSDAVRLMPDYVRAVTAFLAIDSAAPQG